MFRWAPSRNPSVILNNKDPAGAASAPYPLPRQSFTLAGGHRSSQWPSYPSTPATCPGNDHRPGPALVFSITFSTFFAFVRRSGEKKRREGNREDTHARARARDSCANYFSSSFVTLRVIRDCYRPFPVNHPDRLDRHRRIRRYRRRGC